MIRIFERFLHHSAALAQEKPAPTHIPFDRADLRAIIDATKIDYNPYGTGLADGWQKLADVLNGVYTNNLSPEMNCFRLRDALHDIAEAIRTAPPVSGTVEIPATTIRTLRIFRYILTKTAQQLEDRPVDRSALSDHVRLFKRTATNRDYPELTRDGRDAALLRRADHAMVHHLEKFMVGPSIESMGYKLD